MRSFMLCLFVFVLFFGTGVYFYYSMPERMAVHWDFNGNVDGYMSKFSGLFVLPLIVCVSVLFMVLISYSGFLKNLGGKAEKYYEGFVILFSGFMYSVFLSTILYNLGFNVDLLSVVFIGLGVLLFYSGFLLENVKRNVFIGIRTPWTLRDEEVWSKTHRVAGKLFKILGIFVVVSWWFYRSFLVVVLGLLLVVLYCVLYSYLEFRKKHG